LLLPSSVGGALANLAVALLGRVSVNLNFTVSPEAYKSALAQAEIRTILTSRRFIEKVAPLKDIGRLVFIEDLAARIGGAARVKALLKALFLPAAWAGLTRHSAQSDGGRGASADDVATIIFSSGTTGEPKGVMLSHRNLLSNVEALRLVFRPAKTDNLCAILPFFHSFGLTACLWFPLLNGLAAGFHTSPLDGQTIAGLVRGNRCTLLFTTPTFLLAYLRRATREDFATLRLVITGAEKLKARVTDAFEEKFGVRPFEGYGATELSPVAALNLPDAEQGGVRQQGHREGSVGRPIPGVAAKIVDPETGVVLPADQPGLLLIKGPNVMAGYLKRPDLTAQVMRDGWYVTGDIACLDEDGFLTITDRQSRFSKIGGEMVPHLAVEEELQRELKKTEPVVAVTAVPDEKRGERLVVLYTEAAGEPAGLRAIMEKSAVSNLWKPGKDSYYRIDAIPLTGSGKLDVKSLRELAKKLDACTNV
ncbi:MAG: AMP-binding protein, partial [Lentisphaerae bacterium]|nr:AMP-binding protein [Lentisphaerota bacterium]